MIYDDNFTRSHFFTVFSLLMKILGCVSTWRLKEFCYTMWIRCSDITDFKSTPYKTDTPMGHIQNCRYLNTNFYLHIQKFYNYNSYVLEVIWIILTEHQTTQSSNSFVFILQQGFVKEHPWSSQWKPLLICDTCNKLGEELTLFLTQWSINCKTHATFWPRVEWSIPRCATWVSLLWIWRSERRLNLVTSDKLTYGQT